MEVIDLDNFDLKSYLALSEDKSDYGFEPKKVVEIVDVKAAPNKAETGINLVLTLKIDNGFECKTWIVLSGNPKAAEIGSAKLRKIMRGAGVENMNELLGKNAFVFFKEDGKFLKADYFFESKESLEKYKPRASVKKENDFIQSEPDLSNPPKLDDVPFN